MIIRKKGLFKNLGEEVIRNMTDRWNECAGNYNKIHGRYIMQIGWYMGKDAWRLTLYKDQWQTNSTNTITFMLCCKNFFDTLMNIVDKCITNNQLEELFEMISDLNSNNAQYINIEAEEDILNSMFDMGGLIL